MAGDWIKFEVATLDKPEVRQMARVLGVKHGEALELLLRFWAWIDANSVDGHVDGLVDKDVDELMRCPGFSGVMQMVGWLKCDNARQRIEIPNADWHNGESAKKRALKNRRQKNWRDSVAAAVDANVDAISNSKASTREEKRREDINPPHTPPRGFTQFWDAYPTRSGRRKDKKKCVQLWEKNGLEAKTEQIVAHVEAMKASTWRPNARQESFEPGADVYLRNERWEDGLPDEGRPQKLQVVL